MLTVSDLMSSNPATIHPQATLRQVMDIMKLNRCRQLPVVDEAGHVIGIVTDRDVRLAMNSPIVLHGRWQDEDLVEKATASSIMTPNPVSVTPDTPAYKAAEMLSAYKFGALPVLKEGLLVGIITVTDFLNRFVKEQPAGSIAGL